MNARPSSARLDRRWLLASAMTAGAGIATAFAHVPRATAVAQTIDASAITVDWTSDAAFVRPHCMAISPSGHLHIFDGDRKVVSVLETDGTFVQEWSDATVYGQVVSIAIDSWGYIFLAENAMPSTHVYDPAGRPYGPEHRIRVYDPAGQLLDITVECADGTRFIGLAAILFAGDGALYVADGARVLKLNVPNLGVAPDDT